MLGGKDEECIKRAINCSENWDWLTIGCFVCSENCDVMTELGGNITCAEEHLSIYIE